MQVYYLPAGGIRINQTSGIDRRGGIMESHQATAGDTFWTRLRELKKSGTGVRAAGFSPTAIISALRMLLALYPGRFRADLRLRERDLRAFVVTIIPGADQDEPNLIRMYSDTYYPFYPYTGYLLFDLARRSRALFETERFGELDDDRRTVVIEHALSSDDTTARLYRGAILMAQVSFYAGIYHPERGCPLIDFPGTNRGYSRDEIGYPEPDRYLGIGMTVDGHPQ